MADSWEDEDWESDKFQLKPVAAPAAASAKAAANATAVLSVAVLEPDSSKFEGEDEGEEEAPAWQAGVPQPQQVLGALNAAT
jgi:hypothetical protein